ncbi:MAG: phage tail tape measure protein [Gallionellales bacterium GWA2_60_18]|nr:MAG: phage tail tape measure protein [Gallionellales bacterium GWA2_60_18]
MRLYADTARFVSGLANGERGVQRFAGGVKREFEALKGVLGSVEGKLASLGVSVGAVASIAQSARMDKSLTQIGQTAGMSKREVAELRRELFRMAGDTGQQVDDLQQGFNNAVQAGLSFREALPVIDATSKAMAVTSANADSLTGSLTVAATAFDFDLAKPRMAADILDKMTVAGRLGNAELENLSSIFARVGPNAAAAGFSFDKTLGFIEGLSQIERQPERLATLADSTVRLFTNLRYMKDAQAATGVKFFDADGSRRDALAVIADIKKQYDKLGTEKDRSLFVQKAFGNADLDTIKGMRLLLSGDMLSKVNRFSAEISKASGAIARDLPDAIDNSVDQVGRLRAALRAAADDFAKPINEAISGGIRFAMDKKENGGLGLDGKDMLLGGAALTIGTLATARYGGKAIGALAGKFGSVGAGVAAGKALETAAGVTPVFVVNMPGGGVGGDALSVGAGASVAKGGAAARKFLTAAGMMGVQNLSTLRMFGAAAMGTAALGVTAAGAAGYGAGKAITGAAGWAMKGTRFEGFQTDVIGAGIAKTLAFFGNEEAKRAIELTEKFKATDIGGDIRIHIDQDGRAGVASVKPNQPGVRFNVHNGPTMAGAN